MVFGAGDPDYVYAFGRNVVAATPGVRHGAYWNAVAIKMTALHTYCLTVVGGAIAHAFQRK